ncbi:hypothetical protein [Actinokineospora globicatena]|uniref:hypothetical protein n=1 Tax=Actinokineospora globicatena TaxID=103729 RepID=UPI0020A52370|nr:hypothetical protein [Actinokineospora globicatena]MCP2304614.1 hypothetical protein [Actinokineospora globicatena]GLW78014.1 hypothetical protein Aglo01_24960 [Actinokineospora globicatena]GLW85320.1 hypothetical protein Aglo02_29600 [Actinokineospora globicatena]
MTRQLKLLIGGLVCALLPYVLFLGITETKRVNGQVVVHESLNVGGVIAGIGALAIAWAMAMKWETEADKAPRWRIAAAVVAVLGALQVVVSLDLIG